MTEQINEAALKENLINQISNNMNNTISVPSTAGGSNQWLTTAGSTLDSAPLTFSNPKAGDWKIHTDEHGMHIINDGVVPTMQATVVTDPPMKVFRLNKRFYYGIYIDEGHLEKYKISYRLFAGGRFKEFLYKFTGKYKIAADWSGGDHLEGDNLELTLGKVYNRIADHADEIEELENKDDVWDDLVEGALTIEPKNLKIMADLSDEGAEEHTVESANISGTTTYVNQQLMVSDNTSKLTVTGISPN